MHKAQWNNELFSTEFIEINGKKKDGNQEIVARKNTTMRFPLKKTNFD